MMQAQIPTGMPSQEAQVLPLRDIKLPTEPGFWPLAPGWWILIVLLVVLLLWLAIKWYRHSVKKSRWQEINQQLTVLENSYKKNNDNQQLLTDVSTFLRRFVKFQLKQHQATTLAGNSWVAYLNQFHSAQPFAPYESALTVGVYQAQCDYDAAGLLQTTRDFIKQQVMKPTDLKPAQSNKAEPAEKESPEPRHV